MKRYIADSERFLVERTGAGWYWLFVTGCSGAFARSSSLRLV